MGAGKGSECLHKCLSDGGVSVPRDTQQSFTMSPSVYPHIRLFPCKGNWPKCKGAGSRAPPPQGQESGEGEGGRHSLKSSSPSLSPGKEAGCTMHPLLTLCCVLPHPSPQDSSPEDRLVPKSGCHQEGGGVFCQERRCWPREARVVLQVGKPPGGAQARPGSQDRGQAVCLELRALDHAS